MKKILLSLLISLCLTGCGSVSSKGEFLESGVAQDNMAAGMDYNNSLSAMDGATSNDKGDKQISRKMVTTNTLDIETKNYDKTIKVINDAVIAMDGYCQEITEYDYETYRETHMAIRIPANKTNEFLETCKGSGNVTSIHSSTEDITTEYYDTDNLIKSLKAQEEVLIGMYDRAETIEELITIEDRLSNLRYEIGREESKMQNMNLLTSYSTFNIDIEEVEVLSPTTETFFNRICNAFEESLDDIKSIGEALAISVVYLAPFAVIVAVPTGLIIYFSVKKSNKKKTEPKEKQ